MMNTRNFTYKVVFGITISVKSKEYTDGDLTQSQDKDVPLSPSFVKTFTALRQSTLEKDKDFEIWIDSFRSWLEI
jgi:hypothetical protein